VPGDIVERGHQRRAELGGDDGVDQQRPSGHRDLDPRPFDGSHGDPQVDLGPFLAMEVGWRVGSGRSDTGHEPPQRALLLSGQAGQLGGRTAELGAAAMDVRQRLEHTVVDHPRDALALVQPLALEQHLLLLREPAPGEVDGEPDQAAEQHENHDVVHGGLVRFADLDQVGHRDHRGGDQTSPRAPDHRATHDRPGSPHRGQGELPGGDGLGCLGEHRGEDAQHRDRDLHHDHAAGTPPVDQQGQ
jgi:hypothetical protein